MNLHRHALAAALVPVLATAAAAAQAPPPRPSKHYTIEQFMATTSVRNASFSADEKRILFSSNETGIFNVYSVPVAGGAAVPVTRSTTDSTYAVGYFPADDRILYTRDQGGNELNHLYVIGPDGREKDLTPGAGLKATFEGWTRAGDAFWVLTNERDPKFFDLYRYDAKTYDRTMVYKDEAGYDLGAISDDGRHLAFSKSRTTSDSDLFLWDAATRQMKHLSPHQGQADYSPQDFDPASQSLYYLTNDGAEFTRVRRYDIAGGRHEDVEKADWDVVYTEFSRGGRYRVTGVNDDGRTVIKLYDARTNTPVKLPTLPNGDITSVSISKSDARMAFYFNGDRAPSNLYVYELGGAEARRLTDTLNKEIDPADLVESEVVRFKSFDGMVVPSIFFKPHQATATARAPALVWVHGGPGGQTRKGYSALIQYLVNHGYVVLGINNRGSSGYGKTFYVADDQKHGREPLWDCVEGKKYLASLPYVDKDRIGIIGGSYGGYMVLAALAYKPEEFAAGVDIFGVANWLRTLESIPPYWESYRLALYAEIGDPVKDKAMLQEVSPLFHADKIRRPLFVVQGANDPRVIKPESDDIVAAVKKKGVPVEYVVFPDEGHGFSKRKNQIEAYGRIREFLDKYLKGAPGPAAANVPPPTGS
jgi:dipeptidyl aminopeptidase/acylaminoacyl peptidase